MTRFLSGKKRYDASGGVKRPGLSAVVIIMLAIGIGGVTTIFTALYTMQMKSFSVSRPEAAVDDEPLEDVRSSGSRTSRPAKPKPTAIAATPAKAARKQKQLRTYQARRGSDHGQLNRRHPSCASQSVAASRLHSDRAHDTSAGNRDQCGTLLRC